MFVLLMCVPCLSVCQSSFWIGVCQNVSVSLCLSVCQCVRVCVQVCQSHSESINNTVRLSVSVWLSWRLPFCVCVSVFVCMCVPEFV